MYDAYNEAKKAAALECTLNHIRSLMDTCNWTAKQAMDALSIGTEEQKKLLKLL